VPTPGNSVFNNLSRYHGIVKKEFFDSRRACAAMPQQIKMLER
jgi:hypothetical protein